MDVIEEKYFGYMEWLWENRLADNMQIAANNLQYHFGIPQDFADRIYRGWLWRKEQNGQN